MNPLTLIVRLSILRQQFEVFYEEVRLFKSKQIKFVRDPRNANLVITEPVIMNRILNQMKDEICSLVQTIRASLD